LVGGAPPTSPAAAADREAPSLPPEEEVFASPEAAMLAVASAAEVRDYVRVKAMFSRGCEDLVDPEGEDGYENDCLHVARMIRERLMFDDFDGGAQKIPVVGNDGWRFPFPLVRREGGWVFDLAGGEQEILTREIGRNELLTIESLEEYAEAQREYASQGRDGKQPAYATRFESNVGTHDGLHWSTKAGEKASPLGRLLAAAANESAGEPPAMFNGYRYRMLRDGCRIPSAAESRPTVGCAAVAWPAVYGVTGVTTFMVNQAGIVFEKDLGPQTDEVVRTLTAFDATLDWTPSRARTPAVESKAAR
jgi:hypothetical protein